MWVVSELAKYQIDPDLVNLAIIPLGTGNDFSRNLGWGKVQTTLTENSFRELKDLIREWSRADQEYLDLWEVEVTVWEYGKFEKVENS
jgi:diacylglycerol kinase (ATP)